MFPHPIPALSRPGQPRAWALCLLRLCFPTPQLYTLLSLCSLGSPTTTVPSLLLPSVLRHLPFVSTHLSLGA